MRSATTLQRMAMLAPALAIALTLAAATPPLLQTDQAAPPGSLTVPAALAQVDDAPGLEALVSCDPKGTLIAIAASDEPYRIAFRSTGAGGDDVSFSLKVLHVSHWPAQDDAGEDARVVLVDRGAGMATVTVDRSAAGERLVEVTASGAHGESRVVHLLRILPAASADPGANGDPRDGEDAHNSEPELEVLLGGVPVWRIDLAESPGVACLELRAPDAEGDAVAFSLRVHETMPLDPLVGAGAPPVLVDHGDGTAMVVVDKSAAGVRAVDIAASDAHGEEWETYSLRVLSANADSRPQGHAGGLPHAVEGRSAVGAPLPPRLVAQAHQPMCPATPHTEDTWGVDSHNYKDVRRFDWSERPAMSGVPPIEGTSKMTAAITYPDGSSPFKAGERSWWGCHTRASFGTEVPQWVILCDVPGDDRVHYYMRHATDSSSFEGARLINPYTGNRASFDDHPARTYAAAPAPQWLDLRRDNSTFDPYAPVDPEVYIPDNVLYIKQYDELDYIFTKVTGTYSSVPELLPFSGKLVFRATAFHSDDVTFHIDAGRFLVALEGESHALVNGTLAPVKVPELDRTQFSVSVKVSDVAKANDIYIRGINDDERTADGVVRELHDVMLVAEIPVWLYSSRYEPIDPAFAIEPWGCWPLLNGTAWVP